MTTKLQTACVDALKLALIGDSVVDEVGPASPAVRAARRHVNACPACASALDDSAVADVMARLTALRTTAIPVHRAILGFIASAQCLFALPWLLGFDPIGSLGNHVAASHLTRDGAIGVIVGVAGVATALRPRHALAMLVMAIASIGMQAFGFAVDENQNRVSPLFELLHVLVPIIVAMIGVVAMRRPPPVDPPARRRSHLRVVR